MPQICQILKGVFFKFSDFYEEVAVEIQEYRRILLFSYFHI